MVVTQTLPSQAGRTQVTSSVSSAAPAAPAGAAAGFPGSTAAWRAPQTPGARRSSGRVAGPQARTRSWTSMSCFQRHRQRYELSQAYFEASPQNCQLQILYEEETGQPSINERLLGI